MLKSRKRIGNKTPFTVMGTPTKPDPSGRFATKSRN